jgi:hypothetical protein
MYAHTYMDIHVYTHIYISSASKSLLDITQQFYFYVYIRKPSENIPTKDMHKSNSSLTYKSHKLESHMATKTDKMKHSKKKSDTRRRTI